MPFRLLKWITLDLRRPAMVGYFSLRVKLYIIPQTEPSSVDTDGHLTVKCFLFTESVRDFFTSAKFLIYMGHALSTWVSEALLQSV